MKHFLWATALVLAPAVLALSQEVVIDFDDLPAIPLMVTLDDGTMISATPEGGFLIRSPDGGEVVVPSELVPDGVLPGPGEVPIAAPLPEAVSPHAMFSTSLEAALYYFSGGDAVGTSSPNIITAAVDPNAFPYSSPVFVDFTRPVNNLSFTVSSDNDSGIIARVGVHTGGQFVPVEVMGNGDFSDSILVDLSGLANVTRIEITDITDTFGLSYDDFRFFPVLIPEPSSLILALGTLAALARRRKDRRQ